MNALTKQTLRDPAIRMPNSPPQESKPTQIAVMISVPAAMKKPAVWVGLIAIILAVIIGLIAIFGGDGYGAEDVIAAKDQTIAVLQASNERMAEVAETAVSVDRSPGYPDMGGVLNAIWVILVCSILVGICVLSASLLTGGRY